MQQVALQTLLNYLVLVSSISFRGASSYWQCATNTMNKYGAKAAHRQLRQTLNIAFLGLTLAQTAAASYAGEDRDIAVTLRGFGTLGAAYSNLDSADVTGNLVQSNGVGHTRRLAGSLDSKLGLQLNTEFDEDWSAVVQALSHYQHDSSYDPEIEWAYLQYRATTNITVRAGRIVTSPFMESQTRQVSYAYTWVRPPVELYDLNPVTNKTGFDIRYQFATGEAVSTLTTSWGVAEEEFTTGDRVDANSYWEFEYKLEYHNSTLRLAYTMAEFDIESDDLDLLADSFISVADNSGENNRRRALANARLLYADNIDNNFLSLGFLHQPGHWLLRGELAKTFADDNTYVASAIGWYITGGYQINNLTPYLTLASVSSSHKTAAYINTEGLTPEQAATAEQLNAGLRAALDAIASDQQSVSAGVRWDTLPGLAFKLEIKHLKTESGSANPGRLREVQSDFTPGESANVVSLSMDFVF